MVANSYIIYVWTRFSYVLISDDNLKLFQAMKLNMQFLQHWIYSWKICNFSYYIRVSDIMLFLVQPFVLCMRKPFYSNSLFQRQFWYKDFRHGKTHNKSTLILSKELISATKKWKTDGKYLPELGRKKKEPESKRPKFSSFYF